MAIGTSFKQQCPSCEALVPVRDVAMVGKKIECPKCKDKFIVKSPTIKKDAEEEEAPKAKANGKTAPAKTPPGKKPAVPANEAKDGNDKDSKKEAAKGKKPLEDADGGGDGKKKKKAAASRFSMGLVLAVVGLLVLAAAAFFILSGNKDSKAVTKKSGTSPPVPRGKDNPHLASKESDITNEGNKKGKEPAKDDGAKPRVAEIPVTAATAELTNLLPNDTEHVAHIPFRLLWDQTSPWRDALFQTPDALKDDFLRDKLGFHVLDIDDLIRAEHYGDKGWSFTVVHFQKIIDQEAVKKALGLKPAPAIKDHLMYRVGQNPWFNQLARATLGVPHVLAGIQDRRNNLFAHFYNPQTLIFADEAPLAALLKENKQFKSLADTDTPAPKADVPAPKPAEQLPVKPRAAKKKGNKVEEPPPPVVTAEEKANAAPTPAPAARLETYVTIKPALKAMLDHMENAGPGGKDRVLFSSATDLDAARLGDKVRPEFKRFLWFPREVWDVTLLLQDRNPRLRALGVAIVQKDDRVFAVRNDLHCPLDNDARNLRKELAEDIAPQLARFAESLLAHKVQVPKKEALKPVDPANVPTPVPVPRGKGPASLPKRKGDARFQNHGDAK